eukprot:CAMPEP_0172534674 /NCGR_PEP_ID=MMETSP1067-20121228/6949_1 /TAXON_ID=265564 ORGANISM="Thalassiosira punctigera, Strain Tpunct2005C2" /NCGR_SAMPLE_ID=MMETSP1067 /ASSEMBLY_ACC=CAM_ASM_000444 /LENGTH=210 /DNA_ID=CAMNT_0013319489 /DNA_START=1 /DNA_END=633 /DNA_ORIENTATION=+
MKSIAISLLAATLAKLSDASVKFQFDTATCDGDLFYDLDIAVTCDGADKPNCLFGDEATIEGTVEALNSFSDENVTFKACLWGYCPEDNIRSAGTLCDNFLMPMENQTCGDAGIYAVYNTEIIPSADIPNSWSWLVKIIIGVGVGECEAEASGSSYQMAHGVTYSMMGALIGTAFGAAYAARNKLICTDGEDDERAADDFIEMSCPGGVV